MCKYIALKDIMEEGWDIVPGEIKKDAILECDDWNKVRTLMYNGKPVCDEDSVMAKKYFKLIEDEVLNMIDKNGIDPDKDCGTVRCTYRCEQCPFDIPEIVDNDPKALKC
jgi:hypothetical protein